MADAPEIDLSALHDAIKIALAAQFPTATVDFYGRPGEKTGSPSIYFELESIEPSDPDDVGTEQFDCILRFSAYCVVSYKSANETKAKLVVRSLAASVLKFIRGQRWDQPVTQAVMLGAFPDTFELPVDQYEVQRVEWEHRGFIGESAWETTGEPPDELYTSEPEAQELTGTALPTFPQPPDPGVTPGLPVSEL